MRTSLLWQFRKIVDFVYVNNAAFHKPPALILNDFVFLGELAEDLRRATRSLEVASAVVPSRWGSGPHSRSG